MDADNLLQEYSEWLMSIKHLNRRPASISRFAKEYESLTHLGYLCDIRKENFWTYVYKAKTIIAKYHANERISVW